MKDCSEFDIMIEICGKLDKRWNKTDEILHLNWR